MVRFRKLIYHPESESLFEVFDECDFIESMSEGYCVDVTNVKEFEDRFQTERSL